MTYLSFGKKPMRFLVFLSCVFYTVFLTGQSLTGTNGLFKIPSAYVFEDGVSYLGASFYPKGTYELYDKGDQFTGMPTFITLSLFNKVEFMFRYTHQLGQTVSPETEYFPDRMFSLRYNLLKESSLLPALTLGLHDVSEALGGTTALPWFLATYIVASKSYKTRGLVVSPTFGFAGDLFGISRPLVFDGMFAGIDLSSIHFPHVSLVGEYDSNQFNVAIKTTIFSHLHFAVGLLDFQQFSGFFTYRFNLSSR